MVGVVMDDFHTPEADKREDFEFPFADHLGTIIINLDDKKQSRGRKYAALGQILCFGLVFLVISAIGWSANRAEQHYAADDKINQERNVAWKR